MRYFIIFFSIFTLLHLDADAAKKRKRGGSRIRNQGVPIAPKDCSNMQVDSDLSRLNKKVLGTKRHSIMIENSNNEKSISLLQDKGEKICYWDAEQWKDIQEDNQLPDISEFKFYINEFDEFLIPYVQRANGSYFSMYVPFKTCELTQAEDAETLQLPKCVKPKVVKKVKSKKKYKNKSKTKTTVNSKLKTKYKTDLQNRTKSKKKK